MRSIFVLKFVLCGFICGVVAHKWQFPIKASCLILYTLEVACNSVEARLVSTIKNLSSPAGCGGVSGGEVCNYHLLSVVDERNNHSIYATHTTPVRKFVDDLSFSLSSPVSSDMRCLVEGRSSSRAWYAYLDHGTNYCNLRNLMARARLENTPGFVEQTTDRICTQYSTANCTKYMLY